MLNKMRPNTLPWGTPLVTIQVEERVEPMRTDWVRSDKKAWIQYKRYVDPVAYEFVYEFCMRDGIECSLKVYVTYNNWFVIWKW